jgi:hypothetical protein
MECSSITTYIAFLWKIHKTHTVSKKWDLQLILDTIDGAQVYKSLLYIPVILELKVRGCFIVHFITIASHLNHATSWDYGPLKYLFS